ncbi:MAG: hypothetical protein ACM3SP_12060 [Chloroflexota bacterium]
MTDALNKRLQDGTLVRHKIKGYEGRIEGTTAIKTCFTKGGDLLGMPSTKEAFQYRVVVSGRSMRFIAPIEDLEIIEASAEIFCVHCNKPFRSNPGAPGKVGGRCTCGGWICPVCLGCQSDDAAEERVKGCKSQRKRLQKVSPTKSKTVKPRKIQSGAGL